MAMLLYKYCPPQGMAILRDCSIWLTDPRTFADAFELDAGASVQPSTSDLVLSLSASWNSLPMWRDYAAAHTGLVIGFDFLQGIVLPDPAFEYRVAPIAYSSERPGVADVLLTKSDQWEHEDEWRLIATRRTPAGDLAQRRPFGIRPQSVQAVILGCRADDSLREYVTGAVSQAPFQHVRFLQAVPDGRGYHLNLIEFSREA